MRRSLASLLTLVVSLPATPADARSISWTDQFGTRRSDQAWAVIGSGTDVFVTGETEGRLGGSSYGGTDGFLRRYSADGMLLWTVDVGTEGTDRAFGLAMDPTGLYVVGQTDADPSDEVASEAFLAKYDTDGNQLWFETFGTTGGDFASYVVADPTGIYVVGSTSGRFEGAERIGQQDAFLARFDQDGTQVWVRQFGTRRYEFGYANAVTPFGIAVVGHTTGNLDGGRADDLDAFVALFDTDGNQTWIRGFGTPKTDLGYGISSDASAIYVSGQTYGRFAGQEHVGDRFSDSYLRKLSPGDGSRIWVRQFGTDREDLSTGVEVHGDEVVVVGNLLGELRGQVGAGGSDGYVRAFDAANGSNGWKLQFGSRGNDAVNWLDVDGDVLYVVGDTNGAFAGETSFGETDGFVTSIALEVAAD